MRDRARVSGIISVLRDCWISTRVSSRCLSDAWLCFLLNQKPESSAGVGSSAVTPGGVVPVHVERVEGTAGEAPGLAEMLEEARGGRWDSPLVPISGSCICRACCCVFWNIPPGPQSVFRSFTDNIVHVDGTVTPF